jgi:transposase-like protein
MSEAGRPTKYKPEFDKIAKKMCELGATDNDVAEALGVHTATLYRWRNEHPTFRESLKVGKDAPDDRVEMALYRKAVGYTHEAVKIFQFQGQELIVPYTEVVQPDTTAAIFWLKNRRPEQWRANPESDQPDARPPITLNFIQAKKPDTI